MDASKRMMLAKAMKDARAAKAGASSAPAADLNPPSTLPPPPPTTTEAPLGSSSPSPHSPEALQTPGSPLPIAAVPLPMVETYEEVQKVLKSRCSEQAVRLACAEGEMATQAKTMGLLQADYDKLQVKVSRLRVESLEKQVASGDATIEELEKDKKTLVNDMASTFEEGFQEALAQAVCENPGIDVSNYDSTHHIVDGKVVPLELDD